MNAAKANALTAAIAELPRVQLASIRPTPLEPSAAPDRSPRQPGTLHQARRLNGFGLWRQQDADV